MRTKTLHRHHTVPRADVEIWTTARADIAIETPGVVDGDTVRFAADHGPFEDYERTVVITPRPDGDVDLDITIRYTLGLGIWTPLFRLPMNRVFAGPPGTRTPWWAPPDVLDGHGTAALASLASLSIVAGYLGTLITQTLTFAADEFDAGERAQGDTLAAVRIGVLLALAITAWADRNGRRRALLWTSAAACITTALGALAPGLVALGASQTLARGLATTLSLLITVVVAEEMPAGSRAYGISLLTMAGALGAGMTLWALPIADTSPGAWRALYVLPLVFLPLIAWTASRLPESRRYERAHADARFGGHMGRLVLLAATGFLLAVFSTPASQLQNEFLRQEHGFSAAQISLFTVVTVTPGGIGIVVGGRLADVRGRRLIGSIGLFGGVLFTVFQFLSSGAAIWLWSAAGSIIGALTVPALAVYGPELFPTSLRSKANAIITIVGVTGSAGGLLVVGRLAERWSLGPAISLMAIGPAIVIVLVLAFYPETAHRELEEINPEDAIPTSGVFGAGPLG